MKLDFCPFCGNVPKIRYFTYGNLHTTKKHDMITVSCCHASLSCATEDAEELWNWEDKYASLRHRSGQSKG